MARPAEMNHPVPDRSYALSISEIQAAAVRGSYVMPRLIHGNPAPATAAWHLAADRGVTDDSHELVSLSDDLVLVRSDLHSTLIDRDRNASFEIDTRGWLYLHFRLDGISVDRFPDGTARTIGGGSFVVCASSRPTAFTRQVLSDVWQVVTIAFRPSDTFQNLPVTDSMLPVELQRFRAGDPNVEFCYASPFTPEMRAAASALLKPAVSGGMRPFYLKAKAVELVCLAVEQVGRPAPQSEPPLRLSHRDVRALQEAKGLVDHASANYPLEQLARRVGINRRKLALGFKILFGCTVGEYQRDVRLESARRILEDRTGSVTYAASVACYSDVGSFGKAYKAKYGRLPSQTRPAAPRRSLSHKSNASPISE